MRSIPDARTSWLWCGVLLCGCTGVLSSESADDTRADAAVAAHEPRAGATDGGTDGAPAPDEDAPVGEGAETMDAGTSGPTDAATPEGPDGGAPVDGPEGQPSPFLPTRVLQSVAGGAAHIYNPHQDMPFFHRGSGHTHCAPDHSGIPADTQERRLRDLPGDHAHDFVWMTSHQFVPADPGVSGFLHMYGSEIYTGTLPSGGAPHVIALLPDDALVGPSDPFGRYDPFGETLRAVRDAGGLPTFAHPSRYSPSIGEVVEQGDYLWGIEVVSGGTDPADNEPYLDARLSAGHYTCLSAGGDIHDEDWSLTRGHHLVASENETPTREDIFAQVRACNFFACRTLDEADTPITDPSVVVSGGEIVFSAEQAVDVDFIGDDGAVLSSSHGEPTARYAPIGDETYVRLHARNGSNGECFSQPLWLYPE